MAFRCNGPIAKVTAGRQNFLITSAKDFCNNIGQLRAYWKLAPASIEPSRAIDLSDATFVAPGQHMKLRQYSRSEPTIRGHLAGEPTEALQQIVDISPLRKDAGGC
jgi:hypothetical protein